MQTTPETDLFTRLAEEIRNEETEYCLYEPNHDHKEAHWHLIMEEACMCAPAKLPICHQCYYTVQFYLDEFGPDHWDCIRCGCHSSVVDVRRIR